MSLMTGVKFFLKTRRVCRLKLLVVETSFANFFRISKP